MRDEEFGVLVVARCEPLRKGLTSLISRTPNLSVTGAYRSAEDALTEPDERTTEVVVVEDRLSGIGSATACQEFIRRRPGIGVLVLATDLEDDLLLHACLLAGARGYLAKESTEPELVRAIRAVAEGESVLAGEVVGRVVAWARRSRARVEGTEPLTATEMRFLALAAQGATNRDIAADASVSEGTVKLNIRRAMRKLGASDRSQAVAAGIRRGLI